MRSSTSHHVFVVKFDFFFYRNVNGLYYKRETHCITDSEKLVSLMFFRPSNPTHIYSAKNKKYFCVSKLTQCHVQKYLFK